MKTRTWILLLTALALICAALSFAVLRPGEAALSAEIYSGGQLYATVSLLEDQIFTVPSPSGGSNTIEVRQGKIAVIQADCPDGHCIRRGFRSGGPSIICLPNALEIRFSGTSQVDMPLG